MNFSDRLKDRLESDSDKKDPTNQLADKFNKASLQLIDQFLSEVHSGNIVLDDTADLMRLFQIYGEINDIQSMANGNSNSLPPLSARQAKNIKQFVEVEYEDSPQTGEEEEFINPDSLASLDEEALSEMLSNRTTELNEQNATGEEE